MSRAKTDYIKKAYGSEPEYTSKKKCDPGEIQTALNWYVTTADKRNCKKWTLDWMKDKRSPWTTEQTNAVRRCPQSSFRTFGHYCRMLSRGFPSVDQITTVTKENIDTLIARGEARKASRKKVNPTTPHDRVQEQVAELAGNLMEMCDTALESIKDKNEDHKKMNFDKWLEDTKVGHRQSVYLRAIFYPAYAELVELSKGKDVQLVEAYSFLGKRQQNYLIAYMKKMIDALDNRIETSKPVRKKKATDPKKLVSKVQYKKSDKEYGISGVDATKLLDATTAIVYNVRYNQLAIYRSLPNEKLSVKGTTITNFSEDNSETRSIKRPLQTIKKIKNKTSFDSVWKAQTSIIKKPTGRLNKNCVILKVFTK